MLKLFRYFQKSKNENIFVLLLTVRIRIIFYFENDRTLELGMMVLKLPHGVLHVSFKLRRSSNDDLKGVKGNIVGLQGKGQEK